MIQKVRPELALLSIDRLLRYIREHYNYDQFESSLLQLKGLVLDEKKTDEILHSRTYHRRYSSEILK